MSFLHYEENNLIGQETKKKNGKITWKDRLFFVTLHYEIFRNEVFRNAKRK